MCHTASCGGTGSLTRLLFARGLLLGARTVEIWLPLGRLWQK